MANEVTLRCIARYSNRKTRYQVDAVFTVDERRAQHLLADSPGSFEVVEPEADEPQTPPDAGGQAQGEHEQKAPAKPPRNKMLNPDDNEVK